jgi:hypothetical protein
LEHLQVLLAVPHSTGCNPAICKTIEVRSIVTKTFFLKKYIHNKRKHKKKESKNGGDRHFGI